MSELFSAYYIPLQLTEEAKDEYEDLYNGYGYN
jgi:hypothetical protein